MRSVVLAMLPTFIALEVMPVAARAYSPSNFELRAAYCFGVAQGIIGEDQQRIAQVCNAPHPKQGPFGCSATRQSLATTIQNSHKLARYLVIATPDNGMGWAAALAASSGKHDELQEQNSPAGAVQAMLRGQKCEAVQQALSF